MRSALVLIVIATLFGCRDAGKDRLRETTKPTYDTATGKLKELTYDANRNGRIDTWTDMDGTRPLRSRVDRNEDGRIDRWEYYDGNGGLAKVGFSRKDDGKADAWAFSGADGRLERIEISSRGDENRIDRREYYDPSRATGPDDRRALVRAEEDTNADGTPDKWETYDNGAIGTAAFDETGDGKPDRRLTYDNGTLVLIETAPDASGNFTKAVSVR